MLGGIKDSVSEAFPTEISVCPAGRQFLQKVFVILKLMRFYAFRQPLGLTECFKALFFYKLNLD